MNNDALSSEFDWLVGKRDCRTCLQRRYSLLEGLSNSELGILTKNKYSINYKAGETIYKEGEKPQGLLCLNSGKVKISKLAVDGNYRIISLKKPVDFLGFRALMGDERFENNGIALEDTSICVINKKDFFEVVEQNKELTFRIFKLLSDELLSLEKRMLNLTQKHLRARLADALILLIEIFGINGENELNVSLKRADIASLSNMTPSNATRVLSQFAKEKIITLNKRVITINNVGALNSVSLFGR